MHPAQIKAAIAMREYTQARIADECGVEPNTVSAVIHSRSRSKQIENRIALLTGLPLERLWPNWYGQKHARRRAMSTAAIAEALSVFG